METCRYFSRARHLLELPVELRLLPPTLSRQYLSFVQRPPRTPVAQRRNASSTTVDPNKPIVLDKPDKFRPPSHPQRLVRGRPRPSGYNQASTTKERDSQRSRRYPHTFPNEGTVLHRFLTNRRIHLFITVSVLFTLAVITFTQSFIQTSPFAHLLPRVESLFWHPVTYIQDAWGVYKLHKEYEAQQVYAKRQSIIMDAQKRRLYRRAHGMEDLERESDQGIDVRGLAPWDDGLTNPERRQGGREERVTGRMVLDAGGSGQDEKELEAFATAQKTEAVEREEKQQPQQQRKRKLWLGIW